MGRAKDSMAVMHRAGSSENITFKGWEFEIEKFSKELRPDVVHVHDLPNLPIGKRISEFLRIPLIYDAHELYPMQYIANEDHRKKLFELEKSLIPFVDAVIAVNRQCSDFLESTYSIQGVVPLSNATESPDGFNPSERSRLWHKRFDLSDNVKIIVFQGGINPIRNIDELIKALAELPDFIHLGFITYSKDVKYYEDLSRKLGVFDRVHYVIEIPWDQVIYWLASSDVGILPYQATNYNAQISSPNKLYEFVVAGIPIIGSTELINVKLAIEQDGLGLSTLLRGVDSYIRVIMNMFDHPEGPNRFKKNILIARSRYTWSSEEQKLIALYSRICDQAYRPKALRVKNIRNVPCAE
jgi:glycosyltransferase involved in cell wall biosynthesis